MKKLMIIIAGLMIAAGVSAHGYYGYYHGGYCAPRVVVRPYVPYVQAPAYYGYYHPYEHHYHPYPVYRGGYYHCR